eukprot:TRINITY_DN94099_c0_g1_i1.p1 TRINITY_DN94099_c0_g1~~TRINITY_DN94099_c0_g1_i1.p1  ORF type:complete len:174 (-),score=12.01 TRINITY_DN94099_c0_g1_i1:16-537(-)
MQRLHALFSGTANRSTSAAACDAVRHGFEPLLGFLSVGPAQLRCTAQQYTSTASSKKAVIYASGFCQETKVCAVASGCSHGLEGGANNVAATRHPRSYANLGVSAPAPATLDEIMKVDKLRPLDREDIATMWRHHLSAKHEHTAAGSLNAEQWATLTARLAAHRAMVMTGGQV